MKKFLPAFLCAMILTAMCWQTAEAQAAQAQLFYFFNATNGSNPYGNLCIGPDGSFYGTTASGGTNGGYGTVFKVTTNGALTSLVSFNSTNGDGPQAGLTLGNDGSFYGTTVNGGTNGGWGTVFKMTTNGVLSSLVSFNSTNGTFPYSGLTQAGDGNLYGTTFVGGTNGGYGTVFKVTTNGTLTSLVSFNSTNGANPHAGLALASDGNLYGTTAFGGTNGGWGTVFKLTTNGIFTSLASFNSTNGIYPRAILTLANDGNFYGTTFLGGSSNLGTIFRVTTNGALTSLLSLNSTNGASPYAGLTLAGDGNLYGTAASGGASGYGTAFRMTTNGVLTSLVSFAGTNGANPYAGLTLAGDGNFYGTTYSGGSSNLGTVFKLIVPPTLGSISYSNHTVQAILNGLARPSLQIEATTNLTTSWSVLTNLVFTNGTGQFTDPAAGSSPQKFYRAMVQ